MRFDVFQFTDRWPQLRGLFSERPELDNYLTRLEQRDQQLERFIGDIWNPEMRTYTPTLGNVTNSTDMGVFTYQIINARLVYLEGFIGPPPGHPGPYPTATAAADVTVSLPFPCDAGGFWGSVQLPFTVGQASGTGEVTYAGRLEYGNNDLVITQASGAKIPAATALSGIGWAGVYRAIVQ